MSLTAQSPQPSLAWQFESSNVDSVSGLAPSFSTIASSTTVAPTYVTGKYGQAINFVNTPLVSVAANCYVTYNPTSLNLTANNLTVSFWINLQCTSPFPYSNQNFITLEDNNSNYSIDTNVPSVSSTKSFFYSPGLGTILSLNNFPVQVWVHQAFVLSNVGATGTNTIAYYYLNGALQGSGTISKGGPSVINNIIFSAGRYSGIVGGNAANAYFDDLRIYNTALTAAQVQAVYAAQGMPSRGFS